MDEYQITTTSSSLADRLVSKPLSQPTFATYLILRRSLGEIVSRITQHFQRLDRGGEGYADVEVLDRELRTLREGLPEAFKMVDPDTSWDEGIFVPFTENLMGEADIDRMLVFTRSSILHPDRNSALYYHFAREFELLKIVNRYE